MGLRRRRVLRGTGSAHVTGGARNAVFARRTARNSGNRDIPLSHWTLRSRHCDVDPPHGGSQQHLRWHTSRAGYRVAGSSEFDSQRHRAVSSLAYRYNGAFSWRTAKLRVFAVGRPGRDGWIYGRAAHYRWHTNDQARRIISRTVPITAPLAALTARGVVIVLISRLLSGVALTIGHIPDRGNYEFGLFNLI